MITRLKTGLALIAVFAMAHMMPAAAQTPSPAGAKVYIINPKDGAEVTSPFLVQFGLSGIGIAPAGVEKPNTGHHHLLIDTKLTPEQLKEAIPADDTHKHFGGGQTEAMVTLPKGPTHPATRTGRLDPHPARAAGHVRADHDYGALTR
jgi:hypothetical protein